MQLCAKIYGVKLMALVFGQRQMVVIKNVKNSTKEPLLEILRTSKEKKVELVVLFNSIDIQKEYEGFTLVFNGKRFRKLIPGVDGTQIPARKELARFIMDIIEAAKSDDEINGFVKKNRLPISLNK